MANAAPAPAIIAVRRVMELSFIACARTGSGNGAGGDALPLFLCGLAAERRCGGLGSRRGENASGRTGPASWAQPFASAWTRE
ncbi:hypothetical protein GCM10027176_41510 [Actinoallomurus bryophytorum]